MFIRAGIVQQNHPYRISIGSDFDLCSFSFEKETPGFAGILDAGFANPARFVEEIHFRLSMLGGNPWGLSLS